MNVRRMLSKKASKPKAERNSLAWLEGLPDELIRSEYPNEYRQLRLSELPR